MSETAMVSDTPNVATPLLVASLMWAHLNHPDSISSDELAEIVGDESFKYEDKEQVLSIVRHYYMETVTSMLGREVIPLMIMMGHELHDSLSSDAFSGGSLAEQVMMLLDEECENMLKDTAPKIFQIMLSRRELFRDSLDEASQVENIWTLVKQDILESRVEDPDE